MRFSRCRSFALGLLLSFILVPVVTFAADGPSVWQAVAQPSFSPPKVAQVSNLTLGRGRIRITFTQGTLQFAQPVEGRVFAAAFHGTGRLQVEPPDARERQQLNLFTRHDILDMSFTEAVFSFTDRTFEEISAVVQWSDTSADPGIAKLYQDRCDMREDYGGEQLPRLVKGLLSGDRKQTEYFFAEMKTSEKDWVYTTLDALNPEEIEVGRWAKFGPVTRADVWMRFPRGPRSSAQAWADPLAREDVLPERYKISATATDGAELKAQVAMQLKPRWSGEKVLLFDLSSNLRVQSVKDAASGAALEFRQPPEQKDRIQPSGNYLAVFFSEPLVAGKEYQLEFTYAGKRVIRNLGPGVYFCQSFGWYPARRNFAMRSNFEITFRSPKKYTLVATGIKVSESVDGNETISAWKNEKPIAVAGFAYGDVKIEKTRAGNVDVEVHANKQADDQMQSILRSTGGPGGNVALGTLTPATMAGQISTEMGNSIRLFENYFGSYPYSRLAVSTIPYSYGQGWPSLIYLSALSFMDATQRHQFFGGGQRMERQITDFFRAHETSHQWWGHKVAWKSYHDQWLSEGFAEFSGNLYVQYRSGQKDYLDALDQSRKLMQLRDEKGHVFDSVGPIWMGLRLVSSESPGAYSRLVYSKGGFVLNMLRMMLVDPNAQAKDPDANFKVMMHDFTQTYDNQSASTEDFKAIAEKYMTPDMNLDENGRLDWFFNEYVYGTGIPTYEFKPSITDAGEGKWKISGTITQSGVPQGWKDVLPLYIDVNKKLVRIGSIHVLEPVTTFDAVITVRPSRLVLCANEDTLGIIKQ